MYKSKTSCILGNVLWIFIALTSSSTGFWSAVPTCESYRQTTLNSRPTVNAGEATLIAPTHCFTSSQLTNTTGQHFMRKNNNKYTDIRGEKKTHTQQRTCFTTAWSNHEHYAANFSKFERRRCDHIGTTEQTYYCLSLLKTQGCFTCRLTRAACMFCKFHAVEICVKHTIS